MSSMTCKLWCTLIFFSQMYNDVYKKHNNAKKHFTVRILKKCHIRHSLASPQLAQLTFF